VKSLVVLNTRPREQAAELSGLLEQAGFSAIEAPAIAIVPAWDPVELEAVRRNLQAGAYSLVVLASQNGAHGLDAELRDVRVMCGAATAAALGLEPLIALQRFSAAAALDAIRAYLNRADRVLVPRAGEGRDELIDGLRAMDLNVDAPVAYRTVAVENARNRLLDGGIDVLTLCSPSAARSVADAVTGDVVVVWLGQTTAEAARTRGLRVDAVAANTSVPALVAAFQTAVGVRA